MKYALSILTLIATAAFVVSPAFTSPFSGFSENQLPIPQIDPPVQPAGYAFAIWGLIYAWLSVSALFGAIMRGNDVDWDRARLPLFISLAVGAPWLWVANQSAIWATILIFVMMIFAVAALIRAPHSDRWWFQAPVGLYAGWLTAASFVSLGSTSAGYGIAMDQMGWAYTCIGLALLVALIVQNRRKAAPEYGIAVIWALVGIVVANMDVHVLVAAAAAAGIVILGLTITRNVALEPA